MADTNTPRQMDVAGECLEYDEFMLHNHEVRSTSLRHRFTLAALWAMLLALVTLVACVGIPVVIPAASPAPVVVVMLGTPVDTVDQGTQGTLIALLTQQQNNTNIQAAATAAILQANAQATLDSANATLNAAQTQAQNITNLIAANAAATAVVVRANARATVVSANSTQRAAMTQDAIIQTQTQYALQVTQAAGTQSAGAILAQQYQNELAASTQTAVSDNIATQTQVAVATSQWYTDQSRQRQEQMHRSLGLLWMWCFPIFILLIAALAVWGFWYWLRIRQANQRMLEKPVDKLPPPGVEVIDHHLDDLSMYLENGPVDKRYRLTRPSDQAAQWLDEVKRKLLRSENTEDEDDNDTDD